MKLSCYFLSPSSPAVSFLHMLWQLLPAVRQAAGLRGRHGLLQYTEGEKAPQAMLSFILTMAQARLPYLCTSCRFSCLRRLCCSPLAAVSFSSSVTRFSRKTTCATREGRISCPCLNPLAKRHQVPEQLPPPPAYHAGAPCSL